MSNEIKNIIGFRKCGSVLKLILLKFGVIIVVKNDTDKWPLIGVFFYNDKKSTDSIVSAKTFLKTLGLKRHLLRSKCASIQFMARYE